MSRIDTKKVGNRRAVAFGSLADLAEEARHLAVELLGRDGERDARGAGVGLLYGDFHGNQGGWGRDGRRPGPRGEGRAGPSNGPVSREV